MNFGWRVILIVVVVIAVVALIFIGFRKPKNTLEEQALTGQNLSVTSSPEAESLPVATGNIDETVNALIQDVDKEISGIYGDSTDSSAVTYDNSEISNFGQSYENEF